MSEKYLKVQNLSISEILFNFINNEIIPGSGIEEKRFWKGFNDSVHQLAEKNRRLIKMREQFQMNINKWHIDNKDKEFKQSEYQNFLRKIGYLVENKGDFFISPKNIDNEISIIAGPQLVVPITNSRYALNAANARWMSMYDSLYGTDVIESEESASERYDPERGMEVIKYSKNFLNKHFSLEKSNWEKVNKIEIKENKLLLITDKEKLYLKDKKKFIGYRGEKKNPTAVILKNNNLHIEIIINRYAYSAKSDPAGIADIILESAIFYICDHEDSVAA